VSWLDDDVFHQQVEQLDDIQHRAVKALPPGEWDHRTTSAGRAPPRERAVTAGRERAPSA
jgi:hypothetical protein